MDTKDLLKDSFLSLYDKYGYDKITVKNVCEKAHVARSTFYFYYQNINEVKEEIENDTIKNVRLYCENIYSDDFESQFFRTMDYIKESKVFYVFLVKQPNAFFIEKFKNEIIKHFEDNFNTNKNSKNYALELELFASAIITYYTYYLKHPNETDLDNISVKVKKIRDLIKLFI